MSASFGDLWTEPPQGRLSLTRTWGNVGALVLSVAFLRLAWTRDVSYDVFLGYAFGLAVVTSPSLASKLMGLRYGQAPPAVTVPVTRASTTPVS